MTGAREFELVGDLSELPDSATGARHLVWWGNTGFMVIEGTAFALAATAFALAATAYLYLMTQASVWPPKGDALPGLFWSGIFTGGLLLSGLPNLWVLRCAKNRNLAGVRWGTFAMTVIALLLFVPRGFEFAHFGVPWHRDSYGSLIWMLLLLHTTHVVTDWFDTAVLGVLLFTHEVGDDQFADVEDNANYWTFVVLCWIPIYALI
jgi:heme/copper-type cytochrome/quinol oxidase subunit 3